MARFTYPVGSGGGSASADIADFIFINEDENNSKMTLPINKEMTIETTRDDDSDCDINIRAADDVFITALGDDINISAFNEVSIESDDENYTWTFTNSGNFDLPGDGYISNPSNSSGDPNTPYVDTLHLVPDGDLDNDRYIILDPTSPNHIHIRAGGEMDNSLAQLILGGEKAHVSVTDNSHDVGISTYDAEGDNYYGWNFGNDGVLNGPAGGLVTVYGLNGVTDSELLISSLDNAIVLSASNGEFLNNASIPSNQIATIGDVDAVATLYHGSFYSTQDQSASANTAIAMTFNETDFSSGVDIENNSEITIINAGKYNIQFSAQLYHLGGGGNGKTVNIWLAKNGSPLANSNTKVTVQPDYPHAVAAWNFFVDAAAGDYYELMWATDNESITIQHEPSNTYPAIPSVILTVNQIA